MDELINYVDTANSYHVYIDEIEECSISMGRYILIGLEKGGNNQCFSSCVSVEIPVVNSIDNAVIKFIYADRQIGRFKSENRIDIKILENDEIKHIYSVDMSGFSMMENVKVKIGKIEKNNKVIIEFIDKKTGEVIEKGVEGCIINPNVVTIDEE